MGSVICTFEYKENEGNNECWSIFKNTVFGMFHSLSFHVTKLTEKTIRIAVIIINEMTLYYTFDEKFTTKTFENLNNHLIGIEKYERYIHKKQKMEQMEKEFQYAKNITPKEYPYILHQNKVLRVLFNKDSSRVVIQSEIRFQKSVETLVKDYRFKPMFSSSQQFIKEEKFKEYYHLDLFGACFDCVRMNRYNSEGGLILYKSVECPECTKKHDGIELLTSGRKTIRSNNETIMQTVYHIQFKTAFTHGMKENNEYIHKAITQTLYKVAFHYYFNQLKPHMKEALTLVPQHNECPMLIKTLMLFKQMKLIRIPQQPFDFMKLDRKIQLQICRYVEPTDLIALQQVNKHMYHLLQSKESEFVWNFVYLHHQDISSFDHHYRSEIESNVLYCNNHPINNSLNTNDSHNGNDSKYTNKSNELITENNYWYSLCHREYKRTMRWYTLTLNKYEGDANCCPTSLLPSSSFQLPSFLTKEKEYYFCWNNNWKCSMFKEKR